LSKCSSASNVNTVNVLLSGGIDSAALLGFYLRNRFKVRALFVNFGQPAAEQELRAAKSLSKYYRVPLSIFTASCDVVFSPGEISGRNAFLIFAALLFSRGRSCIIAIGIHAGTPYFDCREGFIKSSQTIVDGYAAGSIRIAAPFLNWNKRMIWEFARKCNLPLNLTYSCEAGCSRPCGSCLSCKDREALDAL